MYLLTAWPNILYFISRKKLEYLLNSSEFAQSHVSKIVLVFKRFHVESFVWIRHRVEIFILNFSKYRVFTRTHAPHVCLAIYSPMHVYTMPLGILWLVESISGFSKPLGPECKQRFVLTLWFWERFTGRVDLPQVNLERNARATNDLWQVYGPR
jgi:hypothetical protein